MVKVWKVTSKTQLRESFTEGGHFLQTRAGAVSSFFDEESAFQAFKGAPEPCSVWACEATVRITQRGKRRLHYNGPGNLLVSRYEEDGEIVTEFAEEDDEL